jgi:hypothetical protein
MVNMNIAPIGTLSIVKVLEHMLDHHKYHLHKIPN